MWSDLEDEAGGFLVRKHTINMPPGTQRSYRVTADALGAGRITAICCFTWKPACFARCASMRSSIATACALGWLAGATAQPAHDEHAAHASNATPAADDLRRRARRRVSRSLRDADERHDARESAEQARAARPARVAKRVRRRRAALEPRYLDRSRPPQAPDPQRRRPADGNTERAELELFGAERLRRGGSSSPVRAPTSRRDGTKNGRPSAFRDWRRMDWTSKRRRTSAAAAARRCV